MSKLSCRGIANKVAPDDWSIKRAIQAYRWNGPGVFYDCAPKPILEVVRAYLLHFQTDAYWSVIIQGGVRGFSLLLHEWVELDHFEAQKVNILSSAKRQAAWPRAHSVALYYEHQFLQAVARSEGCCLTLRELIQHNPHGDIPCDDWAGDWCLMERHLPWELPAAEIELRPKKAKAAKEFYETHFFKEVWANAF
jgi:hypothetical protein